MNKMKYSSTFLNAYITLRTMLLQLPDSVKAKPLANGVRADNLIVNITCQLTAREFKLLKLYLLIHAKFISEQAKFVTYSFLMKEMKIGYLELIGLMKELGIFEEDNGLPPSDCLVANEGDDMPPIGFLTCGNPHREHLTPELHREYADGMIDRHFEFYGLKRVPIAKTFKEANGKIRNLIPRSRYMAFKPDAQLGESQERFVEHNGILRRVA